MNKIALVADSTCDMPQEYIAKHQIYQIPLLVVFNDDTFQDGIDINAEILYQKVEQYNILPKTAAISVPRFIEEFTNILKNHEQILFIPIGKEFSSTYQNAVIAANQFAPGKVVVHDSATLSSGIAIQLLKAAKMIAAGTQMPDIVAYLQEMRERIHTSFAIEKMDYLRKGGRCSGLAYIVGNILKIKPIIEVRNGKMIVGAKRIGHFNKALDYLIEKVLAHGDNLDKDCLFITHSLGFEHEAYIKNKIADKVKVDVIISSIAGSVISSHCGKGTIGILYTINNK